MAEQFKATHRRRKPTKLDEKVYAILLFKTAHVAVYDVKIGKIIKPKFSASADYFDRNFVPIGV